MTHPFPSISRLYTTRRNTSRCLPFLKLWPSCAEGICTCQSPGLGGQQGVAYGPWWQLAPEVSSEIPAAMSHLRPHMSFLVPFSAAPYHLRHFPPLQYHIRKLRRRPHDFRSQGGRSGATPGDGHPKWTWAHLGEA